MSPKYDLSQATFTAPVSVGDNNTVLVEKFGVFLDNATIAHKRANDVKILIRNAQRAIAEDEQIDSQRKVEATNMLAQVTDEVSASRSADQKGLRHYWSKFVNLVKDSATVISCARELARLLGLPLP